MRGRRRGHAVAALLAAAVALSGCSGIGAPAPEVTSTPSAEQVPAEWQPYYRQLLVWEPCEGGLQCTTAIAPLDWAEPSGERLELALVRRPATAARLGSLFINPGGPGGSGFDWVAQLGAGAATPRVAANYDLVGLDPRGVGQSTAVSCAATDRERDAWFFGTVPGEVGSAAWLQAARAEVAAWTAGCVEHSGALLAHVDTGSAARDLDMLRAALGHETLDFVGYSYGSYLGARYAELFPDRVGRFVLDGAIDPTLTGSELVIGQAVGFEAAFRTWLEVCLGEADCPFRGSVDDAIARVDRMFDALAASPLRHTDGRELTSELLFNAIIVPLYDPISWGYLTLLFAELEVGTADTAFVLIDSLLGRDSEGEYSGNQSEAQTAINCLDIPFDPDEEAMRAEAAELARQAPLFGPLMAWGGMGCEFWPVGPVGERAAISAAGAGDIVVIGTTGDPATPYAWSQSLAAQLEGGVLLTYEGEGHTAYHRASPCIDEAVDRWLVDGVAPQDGLVC